MRFLKRWLLRATLVIVLVPTAMVVSLRWIDPPTSAFILKHNVDRYLSGSGEYATYPWTPWDRISPYMSVAVIAAEDQRFPDHFGIDFTELEKALSEEDGEFRGASTITQQTAKNLFLWSGRSYLRKALEATLALAMEACLSKQRILEIYLNIAQTGESYFGVTIASKQFFNKLPERLNQYDAARIAAVLPNPVEYSIARPSAYVLKRQKWIMKQVNQLGGAALLEKLQ